MARASDTRPSPLWLAAGTGLVGVSLGAAAVLFGLQAGPRELREREVAPPSAAQECAAPAVERPATEGAGAGTLVEAVAATRDAVVNVTTGRTLGAGVIVDPRGIVVTNYHVIADALELPAGLRADASRSPVVSARFEDGRELPAAVLVADREEDLAILRLRAPDPAERFAAVSLGRSSELRVGQEVFAVGNPLGLNHSVSRGIVAGLDRTEVLGRKLPLVQLDASINVGNSGGPLFALDGTLVGIVTMRRRDALGIAFAVPVDHVRGFLRAVSDPEAPRRSGAIGLEIVPRRAASPAERRLGYGAWLEITEALADGPAARAGLRAGDLVVEVRGKRLDGIAAGGDPTALSLHLQSTVRSLFPGERLPLTIVRGEAVERVEVEVGAAPSDRQAAIDAEELLGLRLTPGTAAIAGVLPGTPFATLRRPLEGLQIVGLVGRTIGSVEDLAAELGRLRELRRQSMGPLEVVVGLRDGEAGATEVYLVLVE